MKILAALTLGAVLLFYACTEAPKEQKISSPDSPIESSYIIEISPLSPSKGVPIGGEVRGVSSEKLTYQWIVNDIKVDGANARIFNNSTTKKKDRIKVQITFKDDNKSYFSKEVSIKNTPPEIQSAKLSPDNPKKGDKIGVAVEGFDNDGDNISFIYEWFKNDELIPGKTSDTLEDVNFSRGDKISVSIKPFDGEDYGRAISVYKIIANSPPVISQGKSSIDNGLYTLEINGQDPDGDVLTFYLKESPKGMKIDSKTGKITWKVEPKDTGKHNFIVSASDGHGGEVRSGLSVFIK